MVSKFAQKGPMNWEIYFWDTAITCMLLVTTVFDEMTERSIQSPAVLLIQPFD